ncbi:MAG: hypothetical protein PWR03_1459 [Tenuifilum sp.]|jgi:hypothetical protein|uniref:hypothetical protein n=1 Tax=Tenuifilum sp. TaxID=2760880 RepID=UPI0024ABAC8C|nr:hypothetical protein [Tenuifilum sp.]MDI3527276.1 hypothetical protein [Tenuifilum sp.]
MSLDVHVKPAKSKGHIEIFLLHFVLMLIAMFVFLALIILIGGDFQWSVFWKYYITFIPLTVILPIIVAITTSLSYKRVDVHISPTSHVNIDRLKDFLFSEDYIIVEKRENYMHFIRHKTVPRFLSLNFDKPSITINDNEVVVNILKRLSLVLLPQLTMGKRFLIESEE